MSLDARVTAKLIGETALAALLIVFAAIAVGTAIPAWLKLIVLVPTVGAPTFMVVAAALRQLQGGSTDLELVDGPRRFSVTGIRFGDVMASTRQALAWQRRTPMVHPVGSVIGNPADPDAVREDAAAALPESIETTSQVIEVPAGAVALEGAVSDVVQSSDSVQVEKS